MPVAASKGVPIQMFPKRITNVEGLLKGDTIAIPISCTSIRIHALHEGSGSGALVIEETMDPTDVRGTFAWSIISTIDLSTIGADSEQAIHITGSFSFIRARISVAMAGGAAYIFLVCN